MMADDDYMRGLGTNSAENKPETITNLPREAIQTQARQPETLEATLRPLEPVSNIQEPPPPPQPPDPADFETIEDSAEKKQSGKMVLREIIETFLLTLLIFWAVNTVTGRFRIEGASMMPTMQQGEYILINKLAYYLEDPERGDIIVLQYPRDPSRDFLKRVIGVPCDDILIENETVKVNGQVLNEPYINNAPNYSGHWTVPEGEYFVLGDNRVNSSDSHTWNFLPRDLIVGRGWVVYWPVDQVELIPHYEHPLGQVNLPSDQLAVANDR